MTDDTTNVTEHPKQGKSPVDSALGKIREEFVKESNTKITEQTKKTAKAMQVFMNEKAELDRVQQERAEEMAKLEEALAAVK